jgi:hypothetical protein
MERARKSDPQPANPGRRTFMATALATVAGPAVPAVAEAEPAAGQARDRPVYRETEHIRTFYERSRF